MLLVPRTDGEFASVGTVAEVVEQMRIPGGGNAVVVQGLHRGVPGAARTDSAGACASRSPRTTTPTLVTSASARSQREYRAVIEEILELRGADARISAFLRSISGPARWRTPRATRPT